MNEFQKAVVSGVMLNLSYSSGPISEEDLRERVNLIISLEQSTNRHETLTDNQRHEIIAELQSLISIHIERGHYVKDKGHTPWYMAAKADINPRFWDRYRIYLFKEKHWNIDTVNALDKTTDIIMGYLYETSYNLAYTPKQIMRSIYQESLQQKDFQVEFGV